ncbi:MAG: diaminopimelate decarboxylase [Candidatus Krumholzibacteriia bacterium]
MSHIRYRGSELYCEDVPLREIIARIGTPTYVYSIDAVLARLAALHQALGPVPHRVCYAVKTNSNLGILSALARAGCGFDIVSVGELHRLRRVQAPLEHVVFAGVGKRQDEMRAALLAGIGMFNLESMPEAELLSHTARAVGKTAHVALRVNPDLEVGGHDYISTGASREKFGLEHGRVVEYYETVNRLPGLEPSGLHCHVGSQILDVGVYRAVAERLAALTGQLRTRGLRVESLNVGGGLGIRYREETAPAATDFAAAVLPVVRDLGVRLLVEPGRFLVGPAGVLLTRVLYVKKTLHKTFLVADAGMNDLVRPSLYGAWHDVLPVQRLDSRERLRVDVVGPICESGDFLARDRELPRLTAGEALAVCAAGAYGFTMSSNYNSRPRAAEVLVSGHEFRLVREREGLEDLLRGEHVWPGVGRGGALTRRATGSS